MTIIQTVDIDTLEQKDAPMPHHVAGLSYTRTGYGRKIPTRTMVRWNGKWRRVYVCCFSNAGTAYITQGADWIVIR